jgi:hypothetical protein
MNTESKVLAACPVKGHMIALAAGHLIAIYERNGESYVAEFRDGYERVEYACTWFRFYASALRYRHDGRGAVDDATPLTQEMLQKVERLHAKSEARQEKMLAVPRTVALAAQRYCINVLARLRGRAAKTSQPSA